MKSISHSMFQSAPSPKARGNLAGGLVHVQPDAVSIRPQPEGQGKHALEESGAGPEWLFQSAPSPKARGNAARALPVAAVGDVSIRPQPEGQGKPRRAEVA